MKQQSPEEYLESKNIKTLLQKLILNLLEVRPDNVENHIINFLKANPKLTKTGGASEDFPAFSGSVKQYFPTSSTPVPSSSLQERRMSSISAEVLKKNGPGFRRNAICSTMTSSTTVEIKCVPKDEETFKKVEDVVKNIEMFGFLQEDQRKVLIDAMFHKEFKDNDKIIQQGDQPDNFYIIESGRCKVYKKDCDEQKFISTLSEGNYFGELALISGSTRSATVIADGFCNCWAIDQTTYLALLKEQHTQKRTRYKTILKQVPFLKDLPDYQILLIVDALRAQNPSDGEIIIKQGERGDRFYIIIDGKCTVTINDEVVSTLGPNKYFGELALMNDTTRAATVTAQTGVKLVTLDRASFRRLLPMCTRIFHENMKDYNQKQRGVI